MPLPANKDGVPLKDSVPGYTIRFDRWSRSWVCKHQKSGTTVKGFPNRDDAVAAAYAHLREQAESAQNG